MLSEKDVRILEILEKNSKLSTKEISEKLGIPITTVHNRIRKLETSGVIKGYTAIVDKKKIGKMIQAFIQISVNYSNADGDVFKQEDIAKRIDSWPEVEETFIMTGTTDILIKVSTHNVDDLNDFVINRLRNIKGISNTITSIVLKEI